MKKIRIWILAIMFTTCFFSDAFAGRIEKGQFEVGGDVSFVGSSTSYDYGDSTISVSGSALSISLRVGYFLTSKLELEPRFVLENEDWDDFATTQVGGAFCLAYNFERKKSIVSFVLVGGGFLSNSATPKIILNLLVIL